MDYTRLSKEISYALRHAPHEYGLKLDDEGFAPVIELLDGLNRHAEHDRPITEEDLQEIIQRSTKRRLEISDGKIRALYGHSTRKPIHHQRAQPPDTLYHGTARRFVPSILTTGLKPMERQYVHLSESFEMAQEVGGRHDAKPTVLSIDAKVASQDGIAFYQGGEETWLAEMIPPRYLTILV